MKVIVKYSQTKIIIQSNLKRAKLEVPPSSTYSQVLTMCDSIYFREDNKLFRKQQFNFEGESKYKL